ncbi:MAG: hypothetical protein KIT33_05545 [Candidatus Kapabacteria bacterium]|nr:hypothetical protein [Ignavibacteriota bacterium]MCW5884420.1 hypothetical protein [Candidatus Kapabacteria bacterium]
MKQLSILCVIIFLVLLCDMSAQVGIYPQAVFLNQKNRASNLKVLNMTNETKEIIIDLEFGYPDYDSLGNYSLVYGDTLPGAKWSAVPYVRMFPKRLLLKANEEQVVKFMLGNMGDVPDGTYFGRIHVLSKNPPEEIDTSYSETITAKIDIHFTLVSALIVDKGKTFCEINVKPIGSYSDSAKVNIMVEVNKEGNAPFLGTSEMKVYDMNGKLVAQSKDMTPFYFTGTRSFKFDKKLFANGRYNVELTMSNEHKDVPSDFKVSLKPVKETFTVDVTGI